MNDVKKFISVAVDSIKNQVGSNKAIMALSGGVDSSTAAELAHLSIGKNLIPVYIDTGLMRENETEEIKKLFEHMEGFRVVYAEEIFFKSLSGLTDPEEKRKAIGKTFIREFEKVASETSAKYLIQGTIFPDKIESKGGIKSHHNVGGLPEIFEFDGIVEPLCDLYKDEVRAVANELGLPRSISERMPFPGPGLSVRIVGEVTPENVSVVRAANSIVESELKDYAPWQAFAAIIGKATGVKGDKRVHGWIISIRSIDSRDGMTARAQEIDWDVLQRIQSRIIGSLPSVTRVVYDLTHKPPGTIEYE